VLLPQKLVLQEPEDTGGAKNWMSIRRIAKDSNIDSSNLLIGKKFKKGDPVLRVTLYIEFALIGLY